MSTVSIAQVGQRPILRYCCGEILLNKKEKRIYFGCNLCDLEFESSLESFLRHSLKHWDISDENAEDLIRQMNRDRSNCKQTITQDCASLLTAHANADQNIISDDVPQELVDNILGIDTFEETEDVKSECLENECYELPLYCVDKSQTGLSEDGLSGIDDIKSKDALQQQSPKQTVKETKYKGGVTEIEGVLIKKKGPYTCEECEKKFVLRSRFIKHIKMHKGIKTNMCDFCGATFTEISNLKVHRLRHLGIKPYQCPECEKAFTNSTDLKTHSRTHTGERPFNCEVCGQNFKFSSQLYMHRRRRHTYEKPHLCKICGRSFLQKKDLHDHLLKHSGERPYECPTCNMNFSLRKSLKQHILIHSAEKKFKCKVCSKAFAQPSGLSSHLKAHNTNKKKED